MIPLNHVLVGIDFSSACLSAVRTAVRLAPHGVLITMLHVVDPKVLSLVRQSSDMSESEFLMGAMDHVHKFLAEARVAAPGITVELEVGHPVLKLTDACARHQSSLLVLGTRGTQHGPNQIGTVARKCVRTAPCNVLLVREGAETPFKRIAACVDFSENSAKAVRTAASIASVDGAALDCLHVFQPVLHQLLGYPDIVPTFPIAGLDPQPQLRTN
jgi:universal stress protein E